MRNPALEFLQNRRINELEAVIITHFHFDHFAGIEDILSKLKVKRLYYPPVFSKNTAILKKQIHNLRTKLHRSQELTDDPDITRGNLSLATLLRFIKDNAQTSAFEIQGPETVLRMPGLPEFGSFILLPLGRTKGRVHHILESGDFEFDAFAEMNDISIAWLLSFSHANIILCGDSTQSEWLEHRVQKAREGKRNWNASVIKAPHHGSRHNNTNAIYSYLLSDPATAKRHVVISANGRSHPHDEFFRLAESLQFQPHCTNLARQCHTGFIHDVGTWGLPPIARSFLTHYDVEGAPVPCQGDISIEVDEGAKSVSVSSSTGIPCVYNH